MPTMVESGATKCRARIRQDDLTQIGSFCRDAFAGVTELPTGFRDKSLMTMRLSAGMPVARKTCVWQ